MSRFNGVSLGYDVKSNQKIIKATPGPGDYDTVPADANSVIKKTHNYALNNGGVKVRNQDITEKEWIMAQSMKPANGDKGYIPVKGFVSGKGFKGVNLSLNQDGSAVYTPNITNNDLGAP